MTSSDRPPQKKDHDPNHILNYFKYHVRETLTYVILVAGIVILFFDQFYGGILVGLIAGIYFGDEIINYIKSWNAVNDSRQIARNLILVGTTIAFFISAPAIFLGAAISIAIKQLFVGAE